MAREAVQVLIEREATQEEMNMDEEEPKKTQILERPDVLNRSPVEQQRNDAEVALKRPEAVASERHVQ